MPLKRMQVLITDAHAETLKAIKARDGIGESEQVRRAIELWIASRPPVKKGGPTKKK